MMDTKQIWKKYSQSICQIIHRKSGNVISVGTGFKAGKYILTNNHVYNPTKADEIIIQFKDENGINISVEKKYSPSDFISILKSGSPQASWDFAILEDSFFDRIKPLFLAEGSKIIEIGQRCVFFGFPFSSNFLSIHTAIVSAKYINPKNSVKYIQLDASVNRGNSGGPLLNADTCEVIGIVTLKKTGFSEKFNGLNMSFKSNIEAIEKNGKVSMMLGSIDVLWSLKAIQTQLTILGSEIERATNVGIGFAFELDELKKSIE